MKTTTNIYLLNENQESQNNSFDYSNSNSYWQDLYLQSQNH